MITVGTEAELAERLVAHVRAAIAAGRLPANESLRDPLQAMLLEHRSSPLAHIDAAAEAVAGAAFGPHHLWEDLGANGRAEVSALMRACFPTLFATNVRDLRWKRFLFQALGERRGEPNLRPPECDGCDEYDRCFGPTGASITIRSP